MTDLLKTIMGRKSVRSFDGKTLSPEDQNKLEDYASQISNPFGIPVRFVFLDAKEYGLSSPVITGERSYVAGKVEKGPYADVAFGYSFERLILYAWSLGVGTTMIGGTMKRELFERAAAKKEGEMMPCVSPIGYPAKNRSVREVLMRKGVGADNRLPADKIFFEGAYGSPLSGESKEKLSDLIEMVRWAPSAVNKQPWRIIVKDGSCHFYEKQDKGYVNDAVGDMQKIDVGIAICHFMMGIEEQGKKPCLSVSDPGISIPAGCVYIASLKV